MLWGETNQDLRPKHSVNIRLRSWFNSNASQAGSMFHLYSFVLFGLFFIMKSDLFVGLMEDTGKRLT